MNYTKVLPDFLVIGAAKAGTTSLYAYLSSHSQIFLTPRKETRFFALEGEDTGNFRWAGRKPISNLSSIVSIADYRQQFAGMDRGATAGEVCPLYLYYPGTAERIKRYVPAVKLIAILRNPADRAYSHHQFLRQRQREPLTFTEALEQEPERILQNWMWDYHYAARGFYHRQLSTYFALFPEEQIRVFLFEDLKSDPRRLLQEISEFIGVSPVVEVDLSTRGNVTRLPSSRAGSALYLRRHLLRRLLKWMPVEWRQSLRTAYVHRFTHAPDPLPPADRARLVASYGDDVEALQSLIRRDLSHWLRED